MVLPVNQQLLDMHQAQMKQMADLQASQQDQFQRDLEEQRRLLEQKQSEHKAVLDQQKNMCHEQVYLSHNCQFGIIEASCSHQTTIC